MDLSIDLSIVIVSYNTREMLRACLGSLDAGTRGLSVETFVVDNASPDDSVAMVTAEFPAVHLIANTENAGFARANNQALRLCTGTYVVLLNPDTETDPGALTTLVRYMEMHPDVGAVGPKLVNTDGSLQPSGRPFPTPRGEFAGHIVRPLLRPLLRRAGAGLTAEYGREDFDAEWETDSVTGACIMTRRAIMDQVGMLDEAFFMFYEEVEWCWRIRRAGWKIVYVPQSRVVHHWMGSVRQQSRAMTNRLFQSMLIYYRKTAGPGAQLSARGVHALVSLKYEIVYLGVAVKRMLRAARIIK